MKFLSTKTHGIMDYLVGAALIAAPWLFGFFRNGAESWVPIVLGVGTLFYSLLTRYELGVIRIIPMQTHLVLDFMGGAFLAASPWLFGFADYVTAPHVVVGVFEMIAAVVTSTTPVFDNVGSRQPAHVH